MTELMNMGIKRDALSNGVNVAFQNLPNNPKKLPLEEYLIQRGYVPLQDEDSVRDEVFNRYRVRRIESSFLPFVNNFRIDFIFSAVCLGWIKNPTEEKLNALVPNVFPYVLDRTFRDYFAENITIGTDTYYSMYCYYQGVGEKYTSRDTLSNQDEFWLFYDYFGANNIVLNYEVVALQQ